MADVPKPTSNKLKLIVALVVALASAGGAEVAELDYGQLAETLSGLGVLGAAMLIIWGEIRLPAILTAAFRAAFKPQPAEQPQPAAAPPAPSRTLEFVEAPGVVQLRPVRDNET